MARRHATGRLRVATRHRGWMVGNRCHSDDRRAGRSQYTIVLASPRPQPDDAGAARTGEAGCRAGRIAGAAPIIRIHPARGVAESTIEAMTTRQQAPESISESGPSSQMADLAVRLGANACNPGRSSPSPLSRARGGRSWPRERSRRRPAAAGAKFVDVTVFDVYFKRPALNAARDTLELRPAMAGRARPGAGRPPGGADLAVRAGGAIRARRRRPGADQSRPAAAGPRGDEGPQRGHHQLDASSCARPPAWATCSSTPGLGAAGGAGAAEGRTTSRTSARLDEPDPIAAWESATRRADGGVSTALNDLEWMLVPVEPARLASA